MNDFDSPGDWEEFQESMSEYELDRFENELLEELDDIFILHLTNNEVN